jgi:hypothetical protein
MGATVSIEYDAYTKLWLLCLLLNVLGLKSAALEIDGFHDWLWQDSEVEVYLERLQAEYELLHE